LKKERKNNRKRLNKREKETGRNKRKMRIDAIV